MKTIGEKLKLLRRKSNLSKLQISDYLEVDQTYYENMENDSIPIPTILLDNLATLYGIKLSDFDLDEIVICNIDYQKYSNDLKDIANINRIAMNLKEISELSLQ